MTSMVVKGGSAHAWKKRVQSAWTFSSRKTHLSPGPCHTVELATMNSTICMVKCQRTGCFAQWPLNPIRPRSRAGCFTLTRTECWAQENLLGLKYFLMTTGFVEPWKSDTDRYVYHSATYPHRPNENLWNLLEANHRWEMQCHLPLERQLGSALGLPFFNSIRQIWFANKRFCHNNTTFECRPCFVIQ